MTFDPLLQQYPEQGQERQKEAPLNCEIAPPDSREEAIAPIISKELLQQLVDAAYRLAMIVHCEDVPEMGAEIPVVKALRRAKRECGVQPTDYGMYGDLHALMGEPPISLVRRERQDGGSSV